MMSNYRVRDLQAQNRELRAERDAALAKVAELRAERDEADRKAGQIARQWGQRQEALSEAKGEIRELREQLDRATKPRPMSEAPVNEYVLVKADGTWREGIIEDGAWHCPAGGGILQPDMWAPLPTSSGGGKTDG